MKLIKLFLIIILTGINIDTFAQELPVKVLATIKADDSAKLSSYVTKENMNNCYIDGAWQYSLLSQTVRHNAKKCFDLLIEIGADVNKTCDGYVPPLMHAAKYGRLEMVKVLVAKGANMHYKYSGDYEPADGETPLSYAIKYKQDAVADYLKTLK